MPTEGANNISELDSAVPTAAGPAGEGDDELRQLKAVLVASFPALDGLIENVGATGDPGDVNPPDAATYTKLFADVKSAIAAGNGVPVGTIAMWAGTEASIPDGWALCDGTNNTPNLIDRFIIGSNDTSRFPTTTAAGSEWADGVSPPQNFTKMGGGGTGTGTVNIPDHVISEVNLPEHSHKLFGSQPNSSVGSATVGSTEASTVDGSGHSSNNQPYAIAPVPTNPATTEPDVGRSSAYGTPTVTPLTHPSQDITIDGIEHSHQYLPACYALAFIQFVGA